VQGALQLQHARRVVLVMVAAQDAAALVLVLQHGLSGAAWWAWIRGATQ
jgi:hypothetical protein